MKTKQEIEEADKKAEEIEEEAEKEEKAAQLVFYTATKEEGEEFERVVRPAQKRWQDFMMPHRVVLETRLLAIRKVRNNAISELQADWGDCPRCGTSYGRYDTFCRNDKCRINLLTETKIKGVEDG